MRPLILLPLLASIITVTVVAAEESNTPANWSANMRRFAEVMQKLAPELASDVVRDSKSLRKNTEALSELAHSLEETKNAELLKNDPGAAAILASLQRDLSRATELFASGNASYGKALLRSATNHCVACHTRGSSGPQFASLMTPESLEDLDPIERGDFLASMRQFDRALDVYRSVLSDASVAKANPFTWERALRQALSISVRVKRDPDLTLKLLDSVRPEGLPAFIHSTIETWKQRAKAWKKERASEPAGAAAVAAASKLIETGEALQEYPADHTGDIEFFRASGLLHEYLEKNRASSKPDEPRAKALYELGVASEHLRDLYLWTTHEYYYEGCIHQAPGTETARLCFSRYEASIFQGYTGSRGTQIPGPILKHLQDLRRKAGVADKG